MQDTAQDMMVLDKIAQHLENVSPTELRPHMRLGSKRSCTDRQDIDPPVAKTRRTLALSGHRPVANTLISFVTTPFFVSPFTQDSFGESDEALRTILTAGGRTFPTRDQLGIRHRGCGDVGSGRFSVKVYVLAGWQCGGGGQNVSPRAGGRNENLRDGK